MSNKRKKIEGLGRVGLVLLISMSSINGAGVADLMDAAVEDAAVRGARGVDVPEPGLGRPQQLEDEDLLERVGRAFDDVNRRLGPLESRLGTLESQLGTLEGALERVTGDVGAVRNIVNNVVNNVVNAMNDRLGPLEGALERVTGVTGDVGAVRNVVNAMNDRLGPLEGALLEIERVKIAVNNIQEKQKEINQHFQKQNDFIDSNIREQNDRIHGIREQNDRIHGYINLPGQQLGMTATAAGASSLRREPNYAIFGNVNKEEALNIAINLWEFSLYSKYSVSENRWSSVQQHINDYLSLQNIYDNEINKMLYCLNKDFPNKQGLQTKRFILKLLIDLLGNDIYLSLKTIINAKGDLRTAELTSPVGRAITSIRDSLKKSLTELKTEPIAANRQKWVQSGIVLSIMLGKAGSFNAIYDLVLGATGDLAEQSAIESQEDLLYINYLYVLSTGGNVPSYTKWVSSILSGPSGPTSKTRPALKRSGRNTVQRLKQQQHRQKPGALDVRPTRKQRLTRSQQQAQLAKAGMVIRSY